MTSDEPLYERDPQAWKAHLAEGNATQARKRVSADVILRDPTGRLLLVNPTYKPDWDLPGGMAEANEPPQHDAHRELHEELGLTLPIGDLLCVDWIAPHDPWDDLLAFLFDAGTLTSDQTATLSLGDSELTEYQCCTHPQAAHYLRPYVWRRAQAALHALTTGKTSYLHNGYPAT